MNIQKAAGAGAKGYRTTCHKLRFPQSVSADARDMIQQLLTPDPERRLENVCKLRDHPWCARVDWNLVKACAIEVRGCPYLCPLLS